MYLESKPSESITSYHKKLQQQEELIRKALQHLSGCCDGAVEDDGQGFNGVDAQFGHELAAKQCLTPKQSFAAWKMLRKYWRQLKKVDVILPKKYVNHYFLSFTDGNTFTLQNLSKGSEYTLEWIGDEDLSCTCEAYQCGNTCGHIEYGLETFPKLLGTLDNVRSVSVMQSEPESILTHGNSDVELLPGIIATNEQAIALDDLMDFATSGKSIHGLLGFAGSGKTLLLQGWLKKLRDSGYDKPIVFTAPTNKAVNVLQSMVDRWQLGIDCITCAKLLALRPKIDFKTGKEYFEKAYGEDSQIDAYSIVVIDEASMVSSADAHHAGLWELLTEEAGMFTKLLFVGDYAQLPPVGEPISKVFLSIPEPSQLTEVKRYQGEIANVATDLRENLSRKSEPFFETAYGDDPSKGFFVLTNKSWQENIIKAFKSEASLSDPNFARCLAWTNKRVAAINDAIRWEIRGKDAPRFVVGERLLATDHHSKKDGWGNVRTLFNTSQEMEVIEAYEGTLQGWQVWFLTVQLFDREGTRIVIPVLHEEDARRFETHQKGIKSEAKAGNTAKWREYYDLHKTFAWVDYAYAMTVHKSQGSTFQNVFVDVPDILKDKQRNTFTWPDGRKELIWERNQLLYVALTRASHRVFIYE